MEETCRTNAQFRKRDAIGVRASRRRPRPESSCVTRSIKFAAANMARDRPNRPSPSACRKRGAPVSTCRRQSAAKPPSAPAKARNMPTRRGRAGAKPSDAHAWHGRSAKRSSGSRGQRFRAKHYRGKGMLLRLAVLRRNAQRRRAKPCGLKASRGVRLRQRRPRGRGLNGGLKVFRCGVYKRRRAKRRTTFTRIRSAKKLSAFLCASKKECGEASAFLTTSVFALFPCSD
jgi:hypothetical protein